MSQKKRNGTIDLLRFLFCIVILMFHIELYIFGEPSLKDGIRFAFFPHGAIGVEFFFLVTGWLMAKHISSRKKSNNVKKLFDSNFKENSLSRETATFLKRKYLSILPYSVVASLFVFIVDCVVKQWNAWEIISKFFESIPQFLLIQMTGIRFYNPNHITWYLSSMMIVICILYPLAYKYYDTFVKLVIPIGGTILLGIMLVNFGNSLTGVMKWTGFCYKGTLRGFLEVGFGMVSFEVSQYLQSRKFSKKKKYTFAIIEIICYVCVFLFTVLTMPRSAEVVFLALIWIGVTISFSGITNNGILSNRVCAFLGKMSLSVYLCQLAAINIVKYSFGDCSEFVQVVITVTLDLIFAGFCQIIGDRLSSGAKVRKNAVKTAPTTI